VVTKKAGSSNKPASGRSQVAMGGNKSNRKVYKSLANQTARFGYRADLRKAAVARASAILRSQRKQKPRHERKLRGKAAKKAAAEK